LQIFIAKNPFDGIINCAAYTNVDQAEKDQENAFKINVEGFKI
jgi:dTDP-4-dehydrorhamnose reductase